MIEIAKHDFQPIEQFPLKWPWTDAQWNQLPAPALAQIRPLTSAKAAKLFDYSDDWTVNDGFTPEPFNVISTIDDRDNTSPELVQTWLKQKDVKNELEIIVSWDKGLAVLTTWGIFCDYGDDFCYPISHDVLIWPLSEQWALFYHHEEILLFAVKAS